MVKIEINKAFLENFVKKALEMAKRNAELEVREHNAEIYIKLYDLNGLYPLLGSQREEEIEEKEKEIENQRWREKEEIELFKAQIDSLGVKIDWMQVFNGGERNE